MIPVVRVFDGDELARLESWTRSSAVSAGHARRARIVLTAVSAAGTVAIEIDAEAYLKGPASSAPVRLEAPALDCPAADIEGGQRLLVLLEVRSGLVQWPAASRAFQLEDGRALRYDGEQLNLTEGEFVQDIRDLTGQYAVPAAADSEGAGIEWGGTVLPVAGLLLVVFAIGLVLMRIWHRIDPS